VQPSSAFKWYRWTLTESVPLKKKKTVYWADISISVTPRVPTRFASARYRSLA
jgi:hypothetical protein